MKAPLFTERERKGEKEQSCRDGCSSVGKVAQWRPGGHGFNPYISTVACGELRDMYEVYNREVRKFGIEPKR